MSHPSASGCWQVNIPPPVLPLKVTFISVGLLFWLLYIPPPSPPSENPVIIDRVVAEGHVGKFRATVVVVHPAAITELDFR